MKLNEYVEKKYGDNSTWFANEVTDTWHTKRILDTLDKQEYLDGHHDILKRPDIMWKGQSFETRKIVLQLVKPIISFQRSFLLKNPATLISDDTPTLERYKEVYRKGKYNDLNSELLGQLIKYGEVYEYLYVSDNRNIKSELINRADAYPIYNDKGEYVGFIKHYMVESISYYVVYSHDTVQEWSNEGGDFHLIGEWINLTGLPVRYILPSDTDKFTGRSDLDDYINIIDNMEDLISKTTDSLYKFINPIPVVTGQKLNTRAGEGGISPEMVGNTIQLEMGSEFDFATAEVDSEAFQTLFDTLYAQLMAISSTPSVAMGGSEVANLSETSLRILFYMALAKANNTSTILRNGFDERYKKIKKLINLIDGVEYVGYIDTLFNFDVPSNEQEITNNLKTHREAGLISTQTAMEQSPYVSDALREMELIKKEQLEETEMVFGAMSKTSHEPTVNEKVK